MEHRVLAEREGTFCRVRGLVLAEIARRFASPFTEEQAWAVCYQCASRLLDLRDQLLTLTFPLSLGSVVISAEGNAEVAFAAPQDKVKAQCHYQDYKQVISDLGVLVYEILDYGILEDQERDLSLPLENLIDWMTREDTSGDIDTGSDCESVNFDSICSSPVSFLTRDSGINEDSALSGSWEDLLDVMKVCETHFLELANSSAYCRSLCRAAMEGAMEISALQDTEEKELKGSVRTDMAICWQEVLEEVKQGVTLQHVSESHRSTSPEARLSDFELLLVKINKFNRSSLKPVMENGSPRRWRQSYFPKHLCGQWRELLKAPSTPSRARGARRASTSDLHSCLMFELKVRPPLKPASERAMNPSLVLPRLFTPMELLMEEIHTPPPLRKVQRPSPNHLSSVRMRLCRSVSDIHSLSTASAKVPHDMHVHTASPTTKKMPSGGYETCPSWMHPLNCPSSVDTAPEGRKSNPTPQNNFPTTPTHPDLKEFSAGSIHASTRTLADLPSNELEGSSRGCFHHGDLQRVESLGSWSDGEDIILEETKSQVSLWNASNLDAKSEVFTPNHAPSSSDHTLSLSDPSPKLTLLDHTLSLSDPSPKLTLLDHTLSLSDPSPKLTLPEVTHVRSTATKGELLDLQWKDMKLYKEVHSGKLCFVCLRKKFSVFSHPSVCHLCQRLVCSICAKKHLPKSSMSNSWRNFLFRVPREVAVCSPCWEFLETEDCTGIFQS